MSTALPTVVAPSLQDPSRGDAPGGFAWWYCDLIDESGNGIVVIVSLGLPFLPGYASLARRGTAPPARMRPSVFVSATRRGRLAFWALHEVDAEEVVWTPHEARFGANGLSVRISDGRVHVDGTFEGRLPGCDWSASLQVDGPLRQSSGGEPSSAEHEWTILTAVAAGRATLRSGSEVMHVRGRAYFDRNAGDGSLDSLQCASWTWGRLAFPDRERIWYLATDLEGQAHSMALTVHADGRTEVDRGRVHMRGLRHGTWRLPYPAVVEVAPDLTVAMPRPADDSPFYARYVVGAEHDGAVARGFAEVCVPSRIDQAWSRPLVRMTVARDDGRNSMWLPFFGGPVQGRLSRLARTLAGVA